MFDTVPFKKREKRRAIAGFTLIEVLVTLTIVTVALTAIGALIGVNARSTRVLGEHTALLSIARAVENGLPDSSQNLTDTLSGEIDSYRWQVDFRPLAGIRPPANQPVAWLPQKTSITVTAPNGARFQIETVRLWRSAAR